MVSLNKLRREYIINLFKKAGLEPDLIDIEHEWDSSLTYAENKAIFIKKFDLEAKLNEQSITKKEANQEEERHELQQIKTEEERVEEEFKTAVASLKSSPSDISRYFSIPRQLITSFFDNSNISGFLLEGEAGIGKTRTIFDLVKERNFEPEKDYAIISGYLTPLKLYSLLYKYKDTKIVLFDDVAKMFDDDTSRGLLLSALWGVAVDKRIIHYLSTSDKLADEDGHRIPSNFILNAKIVWCMNNLPRELENIKSRCYYYHMHFSHRTKLKIIYEICKNAQIPLEIADFIKDNTNEAFNIDFRLPWKIYGIYKSNPDNWQTLSNAIIKPDESLAIIKELLAKHNTISDAVADFIKSTGFSRATFFRRKRILLENTIDN